METVTSIHDLVVVIGAEISQKSFAAGLVRQRRLVLPSNT